MKNLTIYEGWNLCTDTPSPQKVLWEKAMETGVDSRLCYKIVMRIHVPKWANHLALAVIAIILEEKSANIVNHVWMHVKYALLTKCEIKMTQAWSVKGFIGFIMIVDKKRTFFRNQKS